MLKKVEKQLDPFYELALAYRELKLSVEEREKKFKESLELDKKTLEFLEADLLEELKKKKTKSQKFAGDDVPTFMQGTLYINPRRVSKVEDPEEFFNFVMANEATEFLFKRVSEDAVKGYLETWKVPPPGCSTTEVQKIAFRKSQ